VPLAWLNDISGEDDTPRALLGWRRMKFREVPVVELPVPPPVAPLVEVFGALLSVMVPVQSAFTVYVPEYCR